MRIRTFCAISFIIILLVLASNHALAVGSREFSAVDDESQTVAGSFTFSGFGLQQSTRAMGFNGAVCALADDSSVSFINPAGLSLLSQRELFFSYSNLYGLELIRSSAVSLSVPNTGRGAMALSWYQLRYSLESWREQAFRLSYSHKWKTLNYGVTVKHFRQHSDIQLGRSEGWGADAGILLGITGNLRAALVVQDAISFIDWKTETREHLPVVFRAGIAAAPESNSSIPFTVTADIVGETQIGLKSIHVGFEHWLFGIKKVDDTADLIDTRGQHSQGIRANAVRVRPSGSWLNAEGQEFVVGIAFRGGIAKQLVAPKRVTYAGGFSIRYRLLQLDYAYLMDNSGLGDTHRFSGLVRF